MAVIKYSIEKNLSIAIANYNNYTGVKANFQMPKLKEDEWDKIYSNISIISFLQGLNIGGKVYNGYSIINNTKNDEYVSENSIYIANKSSGDIIGVLNTDFERRQYTDNDGTIKYFYPKKQLGSYSSIVNQSSSVVDTIDAINDKNIYQYLDSNGNSIRTAYYTALGRERYSQYKTNRNYESTEESMPVITFSQGTSMRVLAAEGGDLNDSWETEAILPAWSTITVKRETYIINGSNKCIMQIDDGEEFNMEFPEQKFTYTNNNSASIKIKFKFEAKVSPGISNAICRMDINIESVVDRITGKKYKTN